jgi:hypothetical protein
MTTLYDYDYISHLSLSRSASCLILSYSEDARSILECETRQLQRSWKEFQDALRHHDQRLQRSADMDHHVCETLADAVQLWSSPNKQQSLFRKPAKWARICLETMEAHPALMQSLPDPKRTSDLFFGVVYSIITVRCLLFLHASVDYVLTKTGLQRALSRCRRFPQIPRPHQQGRLVGFHF